MWYVGYPSFDSVGVVVVVAVMALISRSTATAFP